MACFSNSKAADRLGPMIFASPRGAGHTFTIRESRRASSPIDPVGIQDVAPHAAAPRDRPHEIFTRDLLGLHILLIFFNLESLSRPGPFWAAGGFLGGLIEGSSQENDP
jgi:hypothetical protein